MGKPENETVAIMVDADKIASLITTARTLLQEDKLVDLSALEGKVADLCQRFGNVPADEAEPFRATIKAIMTDLDLLATDLTRQNNKVLQVEAGNNPRRVANAYDQDS